MVKRIVVLMTVIVCCAVVGNAQTWISQGRIGSLYGPSPAQAGVRLLIECHLDSGSATELNEEAIYTIVKDGVTQCGWTIKEASSFVVAMEIFHTNTPAGQVWHILSNSGVDALTASELTSSVPAEPGYEKTIISPNPSIDVIRGVIRNLADRSARILLLNLIHTWRYCLPSGDW